MKLVNFQSNAAGRLVYQPAGYWAFVPNSLPPPFNWSATLVMSLSAAERAVGELAGLAGTLPNPHLLIKPFVRREAVMSSRIEGTRATISDLYAYEAGQLTLFDLPDDVREVENYVRALNYGLARQAELPISLRLIRELHAQLMLGVRGEQWTPGEFRRSQNWIGPPGSILATARFVPPPVGAMHESLNDLERFIHAGPTLPALVRIALIHFQFEAIHPFLDGNGRVGRLLVSLLLHAWQLLLHPLLNISAYLNEHREAYYNNLMAVSQRGAWEDWLLFFLEAVHSQAVDGVDRIRRLQQLHEEYRSQFRTVRSSTRLLQAVDALFEQPVFTIQQLAQRLDVNYPAALRYVNHLQEVGIVREVTGRTRDRVFSAWAVVQSLAES
jgi:Fic family protein